LGWLICAYLVAMCWTSLRMSIPFRPLIE
jgi:hypothetical protein